MQFIFTAAVKRYYENERRKQKENQDGMESYVEEQSKRRKYRSRRHRVCIMYTIMSMVLKILFYNRHLKKDLRL